MYVQYFINDWLGQMKKKMHFITIELFRSEIALKPQCCNVNGRTAYKDTAERKAIELNVS